MGIRYKSLVEDYQKLGRAEGDNLLRKTIEHDRGFLPAFEFGRLFEACFGTSTFHACRERDRSITRLLSEDSDGTTSAAFQNITGQIMYSTVLEKYTDEEFVFTKLIPEMPSKLSMPEQIPGITRLGDAAAIRNENEAYKIVGVGETWIHAPGCDDRGFAVTLTKEALFDDRTNGQLMESISELSYSLGVNVEKRAIDCVIDENTTAASAMTGGHRYHWRNTSIATYGDNSGSHTWDNLQASNALVDWTDVENAELLAAAITDPYTGEPIMVRPKHLIVTPQLLHTAKQIVRATENRLQVGGYATSGNLVTRLSPNTIESYTIVSSRLLAARLGTDTSWFFGDIGRAFKRKVNWPLEVKMAPANNDDELMRKIVMKGAVNEKSAFFTMEPRYMIKSTA